jgi:hypothetical protein
MARASSRSSRSGRFEAGVIESLTHAVPPHVKKILRPRTWAVTKYLPFWLAEFFSRMSFYLLPLFLLSYPTIKILLDYRVKQGRIKINAVYRQLAGLDRQLTHSFEAADREDCLRKLNGMERAAMALRLPRELSGEYFMLRSNIDYIRRCLMRGDLCGPAFRAVPRTARIGVARTVSVMRRW